MKLAHLLRRDPAAPTLRERAAALREGLSRREAVLGGAVTVAAPLSAVTAASAEPHPDAALIALWQRREEAHRAERAAFAQWDAIEDAIISVDHPAALNLQDGDDALGIARFAFKGRDGVPWYCVGEPGSSCRAAALRQPRKRFTTRPVIAADDLPADARTITTGQPWPEAQARADEIVAAYDWRKAEITRRNVASGYDAAKEAWEACDTALTAIEDEIIATQARTLAGIVIKARLARSLDERGDWVSTDLLFEIVYGLTSPNTPVA